MKKILEHVITLESDFGVSFQIASKNCWSVEFTSSNVLELKEKLLQLAINVKDGNHTGANCGLKLNSGDVELIINSLDEVIKYYLLKHKVSEIPSKLKLYDLRLDIRNDLGANTKDIIKNEIQDFLTDSEDEIVMSKKDKIKKRSEEIAKERAMKALKSLKKKG